jgi:hypothetical protein
MNQGQTNWPSKARIWQLCILPNRQNSQATLMPMHQSLHNNNIKLHKQQLHQATYTEMLEFESEVSND